MNEAIIFFLGAMGGGMVVPRSFACSWPTVHEGETFCGDCYGIL